MVRSPDRTTARKHLLPWTVGHEQAVFSVVVLLFVAFSLALPQFLAVNNLIAMLRSICVLGILGIGMGIVVIARGIDLSQISIMAISAVATMKLIGSSGGEALAVLAGLALAVALGAFNGYLIAFVEIPALFATLATFLLYFNGGRTLFVDSLITRVPRDASFVRFIGQGTVVGIPMPIIVFAGIAVVAHLFLSRTTLGRFIYAHGDNESGAAITGIPTRLMTVFEYVLSAVIGFIAGLVQAGTIAEVDAQTVLGSMIFDVILVVVLGGISLVGGRGGVISVIVGALLVGIMSNGMTLFNLDNNVQSIVLGLILLGAIILDNRLHPRDEETVKQGD